MSLVVLERFIGGIFEKLHVKRVRSLAAAVFAALGSPRAGVAALGRSLAFQRGKQVKHAIKQIDRCLSNPGLVISDLLACWTRAVAAGRGRIVVALDWTDFGRDTHTLVASRVHCDGRVIPMFWKTVSAAQRKGSMAEIQLELLSQLKAALGKREVVVIADRGFADAALYQKLVELGLSFIIRFRDYHLLVPPGQKRAHAAELVPPGGRSRRFRNVRLGRTTVRANVVLVRRGRMKTAWCLATNLDDRAERVIGTYARRFSIEETFRDLKDVRFGWGLKLCRIQRSDRRDRMLLVLAIASLVLTLLGALVEAAGLGRTLKANTVTTRTHSLLLQGRIAYDAASTRAPPTPLRTLVQTLRRIRPLALRFAA